METLLPSEVARLVLGYLEEEKCSDAAKCFLDSSHHLSEYRILAQRGRKYPTKVNGCSLKEVLEEYCLVHSIVQESLSSMTEQPNGGSLLDNLRYVVRHCQPVQVHINLHPQGQNVSTTKSDTLDTSTGGTRPRSRKTTLSQGQAVENVDLTSIPQSASNSITTVKDSFGEGLIAISSTDTHITTQHHLHQPQHVTSAKIVCTQVNQEVNVNSKFSSTTQPGFEQCQNAGLSSHSDQITLPAPSNTFQAINVDRLQEQHPLISTTQQSDSTTLPRSSQQLPLSVNNSNQGADYLHLEGPETVNDFPKPDEYNRSFVTKCYGSSIVFLDNDVHSEPCTSENVPLNNSTQENYDPKRSHSKPTTPAKPKVDKVQITEKFKERMLNSEIMVSKLVENINKVWTPAKSDNSQAINESLLPNLDAAVVSEPYLDEFLQEFLLFDHDIALSSEDESNVLNSSPSAKKKKSVAKENDKGVSKLKQLCENAVSNISADTPSKSLVKLISSANFTVPERATPAKGPDGVEVMTPMTKFIKSITSPSGELYMEPTQFASLIDLPASATKSTEQVPQPQQAPTQLSQPYSLPLNNVIEVPRPHGPPISIPVVNCSPTEVVKYSNQEGVSTICTIEVLTNHGSFKPIVPKLKPGDVLQIGTFDNQQAEKTSSQPKKRQRPKRCTTRGGRQSSEQRSQEKCPAAPETDTLGLVTIYGADGKECRTISYSGSTDLPIIVSDAPDAANVEPSESDNVKDLPKSTQDEPNDNGCAELESAGSNAEDKEGSASKGEDNCLPALNASIIRNTPGLNGPSRVNEKRMSFSTPRRRLSHIRALDFNTPPKENDLSTRRANTSPKNMSTNALSPNTTGKSMKSSILGSLFKAPGSGLRRTSKVKAHLFKSPEYPMTLSSGYKAPPSAVITSTPCEPGCSKDSNPLPPPSGAWDEIGGVSLILDSAVSPVKRAEPPCKKELKSWDSDLRSLISSEPQPLPKEPVQPTPKRKVAPAAQRKRTRGKKTDKKTEDSKPKEEETVDEPEKVGNVDVLAEEKPSFEKSHEISTASDTEMAKLLENNLMDASLEGVNKDSSLKSSSANVPTNKKETETYNANNGLEESAAAAESSCVKPVLSKPGAEGNCLEDSSKGSSQMDHSNNSCNESNQNNEPASNNVVQEPKSNDAEASKKSSHKNEDSEKKVCTPVLDAAVGSAVDKFRLSQATFKESFSFETPMKDNAFANMVPQTPCFMDPSLQSNEDTPRTKIIKTIPLPVIPPEISEGNTPKVPPTPTIRTTPNVSPNCASYFQPKESPSRRTQMFKNSPRVKPFDNLNNILVQECSRLEASGMRQVVKKSVVKSPEKSEPVPTTDNADDSGSLKETSGDSVLSVNSEVSITGPSPKEYETNGGCARLMDYKRKPAPQLITDALSEPKKKNCSADEMEDCWIVSSQESSVESSVKTDKPADNVYVEEVPSSRRRSSTSLSKISEPAEKCTCDEEEVSTSSLSAPASSQSVNADIQIAQEVLGMKIFGKKLSITPSKPHQSPQKLPRSSSEKKQLAVKSSAGLAVSNVANFIRNEAKSPLIKSHTTPVKIKSAQKTRASSSKKKTPLRQNQDSVVTDDDDDDSSDSSSSDSSSDSDSNTSSSSSSSDEGTPVKENVSPRKQPTPLKSPSTMSSEKCQPDADPAALHNAVELSKSPQAGVSSSKSPHAKMAVAITEDISSASEVVGFPEQASQDAVAAAPEQEQEPKDDVAAAASEQEPKDAVPAAPPSEQEPKEAVAVIPVQLPKEAVAVIPEPELKEAGAVAPDSSLIKSVIETKDMGTCERIASSRNARSANGSNIISDLEAKRRRTLDALKSKPMGRSVRNSKDKLLNPFATQNKPASETKPATVDDKKQTKEPSPRSEVPKKRRSKSDSEKSSVAPETQARHRCASDGATDPHSDDEDIKLHLSGDEKEEPSPETTTQSLDKVEKPVASMQKVVSPVVVTVHQKQTIIGTQTTIIEAEKADQLSKPPEVCVQSGKLVLKSAVSSKAADEVLKNLLEKGFGCKLPPPPKDKITRVPPGVKKATSTKEKQGSKIEEKTDKNVKSSKVQPAKTKTTAENSNKKSESTTDKVDKKGAEKPHKKTSMLKDIVNQNRESTSRGKKHSEDAHKQHFDDDADDEDEACEEKINTSLNALELKLTYKGLGRCRAKREIHILNPVKVDMFEGQPLLLAPSEFLSLFEKAPSKSTSNHASEEKPKRRSGSRNLDRTPTSDSRRRTTGNHDEDHRIKVSREGGSSRHHDGRSHRNRTPSPRYKRVGYSLNDRGSTRDTHRSQGYHSRRDSYSRRHEAHSSHHRRPSEPEFRPNESVASRLKPVQRSETEDGEISSSDSSDFEVKTSNNKRRKVSSPPHMRPVKRNAMESATSTPKGSKVSEPRRNHSSPTKLKTTTRRTSQSVAKVNMVLTESSDKERTSRKNKLEKTSQKRSAATEKKLGEEEDIDDVNLDDDTSFPVLGEDESEDGRPLETQQNSSSENAQSGMVTRRRAPPRSVNAHKVPLATTSTTSTSTPVQKRKRKLSTSPDIPSEDSCQSTLSGTNADGQPVRPSKSPATPAAKISKPDNKEGEEVAETEILKTLDVESFLSKLHG